ncbi:hypothetical protein [Helicobacter mesocricetorum]|uniref:hypothetical protein n=1 Tax=Helicobacter mesocricetorum TaxID=87012 RepID=UPI000CF0FE6D|nr:hypothetical protein [Helicobacter mesocricetorum]
MDNNKILKQSLIEFHNAISHLSAVYWGYGDAEKNKDRAINHFKRGALDSYKSIIKDFFIIKSCKSYLQNQEYENIINDLKETRKEEYENISKDNRISQKYHELTTKIIHFTNLKK